MPIEIFLDRDKGRKPDAKTRIECICTLPWAAGPFPEEDGGEIWLSVYVADKADLDAVTNNLKPKFPVIDQLDFQATHAAMHDDSARYAHPP
jgi:hypothetical protein